MNTFPNPSPCAEWLRDTADNDEKLLAILGPDETGHVDREISMLRKCADYIDLLRAALGNVHYTARFADNEGVRLAAVKAECERVIPELKGTQ